jgi:hypothetical protein
MKIDTDYAGLCTHQKTKDAARTTAETLSTVRSKTRVSGKVAEMAIMHYNKNRIQLRNAKKHNEIRIASLDTWTMEKDNTRATEDRLSALAVRQRVEGTSDRGGTSMALFSCLDF